MYAKAGGTRRFYPIRLSKVLRFVNTWILSGPWRWAKRFSLRVSIGVSHRKAVSQAFMAQFLKIMDKHGETPQERLAPKTARPKACVSHHDHSEVRDHGRSHGLSPNTFGARPPGYWA